VKLRVTVESVVAGAPRSETVPGAVTGVPPETVADAIPL
jgi:hypothetical protein